jgi:hypothetical protein
MLPFVEVHPIPDLKRKLSIYMSANHDKNKYTVLYRRHIDSTRGGKNIISSAINL